MAIYDTLVRTGGQNELPISTDDARLRLRLDDTMGDPELLAYLRSAANHIAKMYGYVIYDHWDYEYRIDKFPAGGIELPVAPIISVSPILYRVSAVGSETLTNYQFYNGYRPVIMPTQGNPFPQTYGEPHDVTVRFRAGTNFLSGGAVEPQIITAMLMLAGHWIENRQPATDRNLTMVPLGFESMIQPFAQMNIY